jgi:6-pyruvoyltetrahydropterin/6-carboxytetrahydropterin synthase
MYILAIKRDFVAQHYLIGGDWGEENQKHSHHYKIEIQLQGSKLNHQGYLADIVEIESYLADMVGYYKDKTLNDLPEFKGLNPSIEHFAFFLSRALSDKIKAQNISALTVKIWENKIAWASYRFERDEK